MLFQDDTFIFIVSFFMFILVYDHVFESIYIIFQHCYCFPLVSCCVSHFSSLRERLHLKLSILDDYNGTCAVFGIN